MPVTPQQIQPQQVTDTCTFFADLCVTFDVTFTVDVDCEIVAVTCAPREDPCEVGG